MPTDIKFYQPLTGAIDGANTSFFTAEAYVSGTIRYFLNGVEYKPTVDYLEVPAANRIDLQTIVPEGSDDHWVHFQPT